MKMFSSFLSFCALLFLISSSHASEFVIKNHSSGVVISNRSVELSTKIMGRIQEITHDEGEVVKKGEELIRLENSELRADFASATAELGLARVEKKYKKKQLRKMKSLFKQRTVSEDKVDLAELNYDVAQEKVHIAEASVAKIEALLRETVLTAPFNAMIIGKYCEVGQVAQAGSPLLKLEDNSTLKFKLTVKEKIIPLLKEGQDSVVTIDALDNLRVSGKVTKIIPSGDLSLHTFIVEVTLPNTEGLYPGMFGKADFSVE